MERGMAARRCARTRYLALACVKAEKMSEEKVKEWSARQKFARFLEEHKKRKTPERFVILEKSFPLRHMWEPRPFTTCCWPTGIV